MKNITRRVSYVGTFKFLNLIFKPASEGRVRTLQCMNCLEINPIGMQLIIDEFIAPICTVCDPFMQNIKLHEEMYLKLLEAIAVGDYKIVRD